MKRAIYIILTAILAASCVYSFEPEGIVSQRRIVIEGDILIGGMTEVDVRCTMPIIYDEEFDMSTPVGRAWIEDSNGLTYEDQSAPLLKSSFTFDTREASADCSYRLHFQDYGTGNEYISRWQSVIKAPTVTDMSFDYDLENVNIRMDVVGNDTNYYRWDYVEDWEYHAEYAPTYIFDANRGGPRYFNDGLPDYSNYWCWNRAISKEFGLASTERQSQNRLDKQILVTDSRRSIKYQSHYRMDVTVRGLDKDAYDYLRNMKEISNITGSLFAPSPDDMRGNIICQQDSTEFVIGYISAVQIEKHRMYIGMGENTFYIAPLPTVLFDPPLDEFTTLVDHYNNGLRPVMDVSVTDPDTGMSSTIVGWGPSSCILCQSFGGTKKRPDDWPTYHE